nr:glycosyltransferase [Frischella perrara]
MPVYNSGNFLSDYFNSLLEQSIKLRKLKIILINDGSLNNSEQNIEQFRVDLASGEYIAFLDSDDMLSTEYFEKILNIIEKNNSIDLIEINAYKFQNINGKKIFQIHFFGSGEILLTNDKKISFRSTYEVCMVKSNKKSLFY